MASACECAPATFSALYTPVVTDDAGETVAGTLNVLHASGGVLLVHVNATGQRTGEGYTTVTARVLLDGAVAKAVPMTVETDDFSTLNSVFPVTIATSVGVQSGQGAQVQVAVEGRPLDATPFVSVFDPDSGLAVAPTLGIRVDAVVVKQR